MSTLPTYEERAGPDGSPSVETRAFHSGDMRLRGAGFAILSRPNKGPNLWTRRGKQFTEAEAETAALHEWMEATKKG